MPETYVLPLENDSWQKAREKDSTGGRLTQISCSKHDPSRAFFHSYTVFFSFLFFNEPSKLWQQFGKFSKRKSIFPGSADAGPRPTSSQFWIWKPVAMACGKGIRLLTPQDKKARCFCGVA